MGSQSSAIVTWQGEALLFQGQLGSGYTFTLGSPASAETGGSPMEFLLAGVAGCTAIDVVHILHKMRQELTDLKVEIHGTRAQENPKVYTDVEIMYILTGNNLDVSAVERAISLSEETYCSASAMFKRSGTIIKTSFQIQ